METIAVNKSLSDDKIYEELLPQIESLLDTDVPLISNLANAASALKHSFDKISWAGFYLVKDGKLYLGPFQGKIACTVIEIGKGVCGSAAVNKETILVQDVDKFPGHIACDSGSRSEIVVPLLKDNKCFGVLDIDSYLLSAFNKTDKKYLEILCNSLTEKFSFEKIVL